MTTNEINAQRLDLFNGEFATEIVTATRQRLQTQQARRNRRIIAIGRSKHGHPFQVTAPTDFAVAVAEVDSRQPVQWAAAQHDEVDNEVIGAEIQQAPWQW